MRTVDELVGKDVHVLTVVPGDRLGNIACKWSYETVQGGRGGYDMLLTISWKGTRTGRSVRLSHLENGFGHLEGSATPAIWKGYAFTRKMALEAAVRDLRERFAQLSKLTQVSNDAVYALLRELAKES